MECPICKNEMQEGGLVVNKRYPAAWYPKEELEKKWTKRFEYTGFRVVWKGDWLNRKIPNAFFCEHCNKVIGVFDVVTE